MKKITKILLPIASTAAVVAPVACLTSCSMMAKVTTDKNTVGVEFSVKVIFNEKVLAEKRECYKFIEDSQYTIQSESIIWDDDCTTVKVPCKLNGTTYKDGDKIQFTFTINYQSADGSEKSSENYPCKIEYKSA